MSYYYLPPSVAGCLDPSVVTNPCEIKQYLEFWRFMYKCVLSVGDNEQADLFKQRMNEALFALYPND